jgi:hypothetical protein
MQEQEEEEEEEEEISESALAEMSGRKRKLFELRLKMNQVRFDSLNVP